MWQTDYHRMWSRKSCGPQLSFRGFWIQSIGMLVSRFWFYQMSDRRRLWMYCCAVCFPALREQQRPHFNVQTQISERLQIKSDPISSDHISGLKKHLNFIHISHKNCTPKTPHCQPFQLVNHTSFAKKGRENPKITNQSETPKSSHQAAALSQLHLLVPWARGASAPS